MRLILLSTPFALLLACNAGHEGADSRPSFASNASPDEFAAYWFGGKAELSSYDLSISRYGEPRQGEAVLIFVKEDFSGSKQVKLDNPEQAPGDEALPVMKLNALWKFKTGIYDYSLMQSLFTPIGDPRHLHALKQTITCQDWCGHSFEQINLDKKGYRAQQFSYFEAEGDKSFRIDQVFLEDELFTLIRINPDLVPNGELDMLPGGFFRRLEHEPLLPKRARIQFKQSEATTMCLVEYLHLDRTLLIHFETAFPHRILSWREEKSGKTSVEATLRKTLQNAYWTQNADEFLPLRDSLELNF